MRILGIKIDEISLEQARQKVREYLYSDGQYKIFTPNPEMLVKAQKDAYFREVLNSGNLNLCDGFGVWLVARLSFQRKLESYISVDKKNHKTTAFAGMTKTGMTNKIERIAGVDFMMEICKIAEETGDSVFLLGSGDDEVVKKTTENLQKQFPKLKIAGFDKGPVITECHCEESTRGGRRGNLQEDEIASLRSASLAMTTENESLIKSVNKSGAMILFVAFGMGKQEKWIHENLAKMPAVKIAMGVGGAFDYISGNVKRAPCWMRKIGLEWVYRLCRQPRRICRMINATVLFSLMLLKSKIKNQKSKLQFKI